MGRDACVAWHPTPIGGGGIGDFFNVMRDRDNSHVTVSARPQFLSAMLVYDVLVFGAYALYGHCACAILGPALHTGRYRQIASIPVGGLRPCYMTRNIFSENLNERGIPKFPYRGFHNGESFTDHHSYDSL